MRPFILVGVFLVTCFVAGKIFHPFWAESRFIPIDNSNANWVNILVFTPDNAQIIQYGNLTEYLKEHRDYSFVVPAEKLEFYDAKLFENFQKSNLKSQISLNIVRFSNNRQSIELRIDGSRRNFVTRYEATDKEIFLKSFLTESLFTELPFFLIVLIISVLFTLITHLLLKKIVSPPKLK